MSVKTFENNGTNIDENIVKLKLEESISSNFIWSTYMQRKLYDKPARQTENQL